MKQLVAVRPVKRRDLDRVLEIEKAAHDVFEVPVSNRAWGESQFLDFLGTQKTRGYAVEEGKGNVVGFLLVDYSEQECVEAVRLTVHPDYRRAGFGTALLEKVLDLNEKLKREEVVAYAYEEDADAQKFFKKQRWSSKLARNKLGKGQDAVKFYS